MPTMPAVREGFVHCRRCDEVKPITEFYVSRTRDESHSTSYSPGCKECRKRAARAYAQQSSRTKRERMIEVEMSVRESETQPHAYERESLRAYEHGQTSAHGSILFPDWVKPPTPCLLRTQSFVFTGVTTGDRHGALRTEFQIPVTKVRS